MLDELLAIVVLMAVGGATAYLGDTLGLKLGKKRLSLFGLRPRSTASLLSVGAGAFTALLTFLVLLGLDRGFRIAVQHGAQLVESDYRLTKDNRALRTQSARAQTAAERAQKTADQARSAADQARTDAQMAHAGVAQAQMLLAQAGARLGASRASLQREQAAVAAAKGQLGGVQDQLASTRGALGAERRQVAQARAASAALQASIAQDTKIARAYRQLGLTQFSNTLLYRNGQEVGRSRIAAGQPVTTIRDQIQIFLSQLSAQALARGAARGSNGHAVALPKVGFVPDAGVGGGAPAPIFAGEQDTINALADNIHTYGGSGGAVALIARAYGNSFAGRSITVQLIPYGDRRVLTSGQVLAQVSLSPSERGYDTISEGLLRLLNMARRTAVRQGVIPVEINPSSDETQVGDVTFSTLYDIVDQVRHMPSGAPVVVTASAAADTWSIDPLRLSFTVGSDRSANFGNTAGGAKFATISGSGAPASRPDHQ